MIEVIDNFQLLKAMPLDSRLVIENVSDIPASGRYPGMIVYQLSDEKYYKYERGIFKEVTIDLNSDITIVQGTGIVIVETSPGEFNISVDTTILKSDGSVRMQTGYLPIDPKDIVDKEYADGIVQLLSDHEDTVMTSTTSGHSKIDDISIKTNLADQLYIARTDGGDFI